jgi:EAL domain-containing protein (putative c-di-GMP-specific phosphodiesterase class I)
VAEESGLIVPLGEFLLRKVCEQVARALQGLREDGVRIEMDDFGTGYSSLSSLKQLPVDTPKIDRSFIRHIDTGDSDEAIVAAFLTLARNLGLQVVAEGVETLAQLQVLGRHGCEIAQGSHFSRPLSAEDCREILIELAHRGAGIVLIGARLLLDWMRATIETHESWPDNQRVP